MSDMLTRAPMPDLSRLQPCEKAVEWLSTQAEPHEAWAACERGDWMLWIAGKAGVDRRQVVLATCECAEQALVHVPEGEDRPRVAIETAQRWARGEATVEEVRAYAADAAASAAPAAPAAYAAPAAPAAYAAADAAYAAYAADYAADYAASAAAAAAAYASDDAYASRVESLRLSAEIVRRHITADDVLRALEETC